MAKPNLYKFRKLKIMHDYKLTPMYRVPKSELTIAYEQQLKAERKAMKQSFGGLPKTVVKQMPKVVKGLSKGAKSVEVTVTKTYKIKK